MDCICKSLTLHKRCQPLSTSTIPLLYPCGNEWPNVSTTSEFEAGYKGAATCTFCKGFNSSINLKNDGRSLASLQNIHTFCILLVIPPPYTYLLQNVLFIDCTIMSIYTYILQETFTLSNETFMCCECNNLRFGSAAFSKQQILNWERNYLEDLEHY